jgi:hypothetical protein
MTNDDECQGVLTDATTRHAALVARTAGRRLVDLETGARMWGLSYWTLRDLVNAGHVPKVVLPGKNGKMLRRILIDTRDLERFIEASKERGDMGASQAQRPVGGRPQKRRPEFR